MPLTCPNISALSYPVVVSKAALTYMRGNPRIEAAARDTHTGSDSMDDSSPLSHDVPAMVIRIIELEGFLRCSTLQRTEEEKGLTLGPAAQADTSKWSTRQTDRQESDTAVRQQ